jgi:hypothetical protein
MTIKTRLEAYKEITYHNVIGTINLDRYLLISYDRQDYSILTTHESVGEAGLKASRSYPIFDTFNLYDLDNNGRELEQESKLVVSFWKESEQ